MPSKTLAFFTKELPLTSNVNPGVDLSSLMVVEKMPIRSCLYYKIKNNYDISNKVNIVFADVILKLISRLLLDLQES